MRMGRAGGLLVDGTAEEHLRIRPLVGHAGLTRFVLANVGCGDLWCFVGNL